MNLGLHTCGENGIILSVNEPEPDFYTSAHLFGSCLDAHLPAGVEPSVRVGHAIVAGETVLEQVK